MEFSLLMALLLMPAFSLAVKDAWQFSELRDLNATCPNDRSCQKSSNDQWRSKCHCSSNCGFFDTCCVDAYQDRKPEPKIRPACRTIDGEDFGFSLKGCSFTFAEINLGFYMIDQCPPKNDGSHSVYEALCEEEWDGENDVMRIVPVTSLFTRITYKNYFCFRCHELNDNYLFWDVKVKFDGETEKKPEHTEQFQLEYDEFYGKWVAPIGKDGKTVAVDLVIEKPDKVRRVVPWCYPNLVSQCSDDWKDDAVKAKCDKFMYVTRIKRDNVTLLYRNPHCALCNFEDLDNIECPISLDDEGWTHTSKKPFSFTFLLDFNRADGDKVGQIERCTEDEIWDPYFESCRTPTCALPDYTVKNGKCVPP